MTRTEYEAYLENLRTHWPAEDIGGVPLVEGPDGRLHEDYAWTAAVVRFFRQKAEDAKARPEVSR